MSGNDGKKNRYRQPLGTWIRKHKRLAIYELDGYTCQLCGKDLRNCDVSGDEITLEHLVPKSAKKLMKPNVPENLVTACRGCNCAKGAQKLETFVGMMKAEKIVAHAVARASRVKEVSKQILKGM